MNIKVNSMRSAAVNQEIFWIPIDEVEPPAGVKLLLINERNGVAVLGTYHQKHQWTHWQGLPKFKQLGDEIPQPKPKPKHDPQTDEWISFLRKYPRLFVTVKQWVRITERAHKIGV